MTAPPAPLEWHPWYRGKAWLLMWLESDEHTCVIPVAGPVRFREWDAVSPSFSRVTMTKQTAYGPAPYVGDPFMYLWTVGTDEYGRSIASEARIDYMGRRS